MYKKIYEEITNWKQKISVVGLGYVGLPIALAFDRKVMVIGFDINEKKIQMYKEGKDPTGEFYDRDIKNSRIEFTTDEKRLCDALFHIIAVPTPVLENKSPDLSMVENASHIVGRNLKRGAIVVYESTVYPGVTEEICIPILEKESGMKCGEDFKVGYSPERINPGDDSYKLESIVKIVSGMDREALDIIEKIYKLIIKARIYRAECIKVAEAAKIVENSQRDINIAFINEISKIFNAMGIDTQEVLKAAKTKWNFGDFCPGLVGGHCIGVDPYYLIYKAKQYGCDSPILQTGRKINESMSDFVVENLIECMLQEGINLGEARVAILGITFKENCSDIRNSKVLDMVKKIENNRIKCVVTDYMVDSSLIKKEVGIDLADMSEVKNIDALVLAVPHKEFLLLTEQTISSMYKDTNRKILFDLKGVLEKELYQQLGYVYWRL